MEPNVTPIAQNTTTVRPNTIGNINAPLLIVFIASLALGSWFFFFGGNKDAFPPKTIQPSQTTAGSGNAGGNLPLSTATEKLVLTGGFDGTSSVRDVYSTTNPASWTTNPTPLWTARYQHQTIFYNGKLWLMGGFASPGGFSHDVSWSTDGVTWSPPVAAPWSKRSQFGAVVFNNKLYVLGGAGAAGRLLDIWEFDGNSWTPRGNMGGSPRSMHGAVVFNNGTGDKIYVLGGSTNAAPIANDVWSWKGPNNTWNQETGTMLPYVTGASDPEFVVYDNGTGSKIYRLGQTINSTNTGNANVWSSVNGINWVQQPWAAWGGKKALESVVYDDGTGKKLYVMGGSLSSSPTRDVWKATNPDIPAGWSLVTMNPGWTSRFGHSVAVSPLKPDLVITSLTWSPKDGNPTGTAGIPRSITAFDRTIAFTFTVKNIGTAPATLYASYPVFQLEINSTPNMVNPPPLVALNPGANIVLLPGDSHTFVDIDSTPNATIRTTPGSYTIKAVADTLFSTDESDENNNAYTQPIPLVVY